MAVKSKAPQSQRYYGWTPSQPDPRDYRFTAHRTVLETLAPSQDLSRPKLASPFEPSLDQGAQGSCGPNTAAECIMVDAERDEAISPMTLPSRQQVYYCTRLVMGVPLDQDSGVDNRSMMKALAQYGWCDDQLCKYTDDPAQLGVPPSTAAMTQAATRTIAQYLSVPQDLTQMKACVSDNPTTGEKGKPIVFGFTVFSSFESSGPGRTGIIPMPGPSEGVLGGHDMCFTGDTKVSLMDGTERTLRDLAAGSAGNRFWVYSCDEHGNVVPGLAHSARKTGNGRELVKVTLDNGEQIRCTLNHRFLMRDGTYREAGSLKTGDSLMPLYRKLSTQKGMAGYEMLYNPATKKWRYTHRVSAAVSKGGRYSGVVHHADFDKRNNAPGNLEVMSWDEHTKLHAEQTDALRLYAQSEEGRAKSRETIGRLWADPAWRAKMVKQLGENGRTACNRKAAEGRCGVQNWTAEDHKRHAAKAGAKLKGRKRTAAARAAVSAGQRRLYATDADAKQRILERQKKATLAAAEQQRGGLTDAQKNARRKNIAKARATRLGRLQPNNHKVVSVEPAGREDVYDLTVEQYHNFALSAGVFVHNCIVGYNSSGGDLPGANPGNIWPDGYWKARNHWYNGSVPWGDDGWGYFPDAYVINSQLSGDFWSLLRSGLPVSPTPPTPPVPPVPPVPPIPGQPTLAQVLAAIDAETAYDKTKLPRYLWKTLDQQNARLHAAISALYGKKQGWIQDIDWNAVLADSATIIEFLQQLLGVLPK